ncbi:MAG: type III-B CRISPR module RAMP protein Cmr6 [Bryobacteraceae bacterium]|nr:type III-B CRISPR module RAMP protein Cmr6 [Bryobacteraceae bacterium]
MPLLRETQSTVDSRLDRCDSRSLALDRFADPTLKGDERREFFRRSIGKRSEPHKRDAWREFLRTGLGLKPDDLLFAQLQARLMVNMAGGVMENAGLCLDRLTGIPYIPGSAVKGCARRMAIQALYESGAGFQPASDPEDLAAKSKRWDKCAQRLVTIARVFGWADQDWNPGSDFEYACGKADWDEIRERAVNLLFAEFPHWKKPTGNQPLWKALPNFAGAVQFLPAYPFSAPSPDLELDVVTVHHREYYSGNPQFATAPDIEEPVPVVFPAVAPGYVFTFAVLPGRRCDETLLTAAKNWLKQGLETFGLGAKVAAGYGWFRDVSNSFSETLRMEIQLRQLQETAQRFGEWSDDDKLEFIIELIGKPKLCQAWRKNHPETAKQVGEFAAKMESPLP